MNGINHPGYFTTIAAVLLLGGIQLMSIGVVGEYIGRIYYEVKQRPKYIVEASNLKHLLKSSCRKRKLFNKNKHVKVLTSKLLTCLFLSHFQNYYVLVAIINIYQIKHK